MEPLNLSDDAIKDYCSYEDEHVPTVQNEPPKRLVEGINLKDLCDGREIMFQLSKEHEKNIFEEGEENMNDVIHWNSKSQRENRGAPVLNCSFKSLASKMVNVTEDGLVKKQVVTNGIGKVVPDHAFVTVHYNLYKEHCELPFDSTYLRGRPEKFRLDQGETIVGLELAIKTMKKNENSCFFIKWEVAFGEMGCPDRIEKKCDIVADIKLVNFDEICDEQDLSLLSLDDINKLDFTKSLNKAKQLHLSGSDDFKRGDLKGAIICFKKAIRILNSLRLADEEQERSMLKQKVKCLVNMAVTYNKLGKYEQACLACQDVLSIDRNSVKAHFHYGRANLALSNFSEAYQCLKRADKLKPNDQDINKELKKLNDKKALHDMKDKIFWKKAFENEEEEEKEKSNDIPPDLNAFKENLTTSLQDCVEKDKPFILPGALLPEEKKICSQIANDMNISFENQGNISIFQRNKDKS